MAGSFENITVAGPRGHLTRFPILPDLGAPEAINMNLKEQFENKQPSTAVRQRQTDVII